MKIGPGDLQLVLHRVTFFATCVALRDKLLRVTCLLCAWIMVTFDPISYLNTLWLLSNRCCGHTTEIMVNIKD